MKAWCLIFTVTFFVGIMFYCSMRIVKGIEFSINCKQYLKRAADANTVEIARGQLAMAIGYIEANGLTEGIVSVFLRQPAQDLGYWYINLMAADAGLGSIDEGSSPLERSNMLIKLRETLLDEGTSTTVTFPSGISIYPHNIFYFYWILIMVIGFIGFFILLCIIWNN